MPSAWSRFSSSLGGRLFFFLQKMRSSTEMNPAGNSCLHKLIYFSCFQRNPQMNFVPLFFHYARPYIEIYSAKSYRFWFFPQYFRSAIQKKSPQVAFRVVLWTGFWYDLISVARQRTTIFITGIRSAFLSKTPKNVLCLLQTITHYERPVSILEYSRLVVPSVAQKLAIFLWIVLWTSFCYDLVPRLIKTRNHQFHYLNTWAVFERSYECLILLSVQNATWRSSQLHCWRIFLHYRVYVTIHVNSRCLAIECSPNNLF